MKICIQLLSGGLINRGAEHSMLMLAEDLTTLGHQVTVFQPGDAPNGASYGVHKINLPILPTSHKPTRLVGKVLDRLYLSKRSLLSLLFAVKVAPHLKKFDVIIPTDGFWSVLIAKIAKSKTSKIVCVGLAGMGWTDRDTLGLSPDGFVALSTEGAVWARNINLKVHTATIPLQVDINAFEAATTSKIRQKKPVILTVAALTKYKRVDVIIRAVAKIPNASLIIVGQGEEFESLNDLGMKLMPGRFEIRTASFDELPGLYKAATCFVLISQSQEAFGQVLVEAMAANLPIVTTDDPIRREIIGAQGIYVNPGELDTVVKAVENAIEKQKIVYDLSHFDRLCVAKQYETMMAKL